MKGSTSRMSLTRRTARLLAGLLTAVLVLSGCSVYDAPLPGGPDTGDNPIKLKVMFRDVLDLVPQSTVKINDVTVGKVSKVDLKGYVAEVTVEIPGDVNLPDNARAEIRQTSLLGEKFVQLAPPQEPGSGKLSNGDVIGLDRTGRNPEIEEVFGALSLLLNGGGVGQLKTIFSELNNAFEGREPELRSVLTQIRSFMGQLDQNKASIVAALENTNRLAVQLREQDGTIKSALDNIPATLRSVNRQRDELVLLLEALERLSGVGVRVIQASKESTINSLRDLGPVLEGFAKAGDNFPKALQVFLTYPFVDEAIGRDPQVARNLHMGDYTNLSVNLDINVANLPKLPTGPIGAECEAARDQLIQGIEDSELPPEVKEGLIDLAEEAPCRQLGDPTGFISDNIDAVCDALPVAICGADGGGGLELPTIPTVPGAVTGAVPGLGLPRPPVGASTPTPLDPFGLASFGLDPGIGTMLLQGVAEVR